MRGFAIPRRWLISLALVGLVSLFAATLTASWLDPSRASAATGFAPETILGSVIGAPNGVIIEPGSSVQLEARPQNQLGTVDPNLPGPLTYTWTHTSGPGASLVPGSNPRFATFTASTSGTAVVRVEVNQGGGTGTTVHADITIFVQAPAPTSTNTPPPTNPGPVPASIPGANNVITPAEGGQSFLNSNPRVSINVPPGATTTFKGVSITSVSSGVPAVGNGVGFRIGNTVINVTFYDESGNPLTGVRLDRAAEICLPVSAADIASSAGGVGGLTIMRYDSVSSQWIPLVGTYNALTGQVCASSSNFSMFAVGTSTDFPVVEGANLPATGDTPIPASLLVFIGVAGVALVGTGAVAFRRSRRAGSSE